MKSSDIFDRVFYWSRWWLRTVQETTAALSWTILILSLAPQIATGQSVFYVSMSGSDRNVGKDLDTPFATIGAALRNVQPGDTVLVLPGTYRESFLNMTGGSDLDHMVRLAAYDPNDRPVLQPEPGADRVFTFASASSSHVEVDGFVMDAADVRHNAVKVTWGTGSSHHIRIKNSEIKNAPRSGVLVTGADQGVIGNEFINLSVHNNGSTRAPHGFYISTPFNTVRDSDIYNNAGWGIHNYGGDPSHNNYLGNNTFNNARSDTRGAGIGIYNGENIKAQYNSSFGNRDGAIVQYGASSVVVDRNVIIGNVYGIRILGKNVHDTVVSRNYVKDNHAAGVIDTAQNTQLSEVNSISSSLMHWDSGGSIVGSEGLTLAPGVDLRNLQLTNGALHDTDLKGADLSDSRLHRSQLSRANLTDAVLHGTSLSEANLASATLGGADFTNAKIRGATLEDTTARGFTMAQLAATASYRMKDLTKIRWSRNDLNGWDFAGQNLDSATFFESDLTSANLRGAKLENASFGSAAIGSAVLTGADFTDAEISNARFEATTANGFASDQLYSTANYKRKDLSGVSLANNDLTKWDFAGQNLSRSVFRQSQIKSADLQDANLVQAELSLADLSDANFARADLTRSWLQQATLSGANMTDAVISETVLNDTTANGFEPGQLYSTDNYKSKNLRGIQLQNNTLSGWSFRSQELAGVSFRSSELVGTDFSDAVVNGTGFEDTTSRGFSAAQLYTTASYADRNLRSLRLSDNDLSGWKFNSQDATGAQFQRSQLAGADFDGAIVAGANFDSTTTRGLTQNQLYSTTSYNNRNMPRIRLSGNDLSGWDFVGQNLGSASFSNSDLTGTLFARAILSGSNMRGAKLTRADFTDAVISGGVFTNTTSGGFTAEQLYSTVDYQDGDLSRIQLGENDLRTWDFSGMNLATVSLVGSNLTNADFSGANLGGADLDSAVLDGTIMKDATIQGISLVSTVEAGFKREQLYSTSSYKNGDLRGVHLARNDLSGWSFSGQDMSGALFEFDTHLENVNFRGATLIGANLSGAKLTNADFTDADISWTNLIGGVLNGFTESQLYSTANYKDKHLRGVRLDRSDLTGWNFSGQNLRATSFDSAVLVDVDLTNAVIDHTNLENTTSRGFTEDALYSTASYRSKDLAGVDLGRNDLSGWELAGMNFNNASFVDTELLNTNLSGADLRGATGVEPAGATRNMIWPNGEIRGLRLGANEKLVIRDADRRIVVQDEFSIVPSGQLEIVLADANWKSTVIFKGLNTAPQLGGTLKILFGETDSHGLVGTTFDLFNWEHTIDPMNQFSEIAVPLNTEWDLSQLYTTGQITFMSAFSDESVGDFDSNLMLDAADMDLLAEQVRDGTYDPVFDLNGDSLVDQLDRGIWLEQLFGTFVGDANLDREVAFSDFTALSVAFGSEGGWGQGDFDGNGTVAFPDFVLLAVNYGQSGQALASVPEPCGLQLMLLGLPALILGLVRPPVRSGRLRQATISF